MVVEVGDPGVQTQKFLRAFPSFEPLLLSFLSPCGSVFLLNDVVAPGCRDHLLMVDINQPWNLPDRGSVASQLIRMDDLWDVVFPQ